MRQLLNVPRAGRRDDTAIVLRGGLDQCICLEPVQTQRVIGTMRFRKTIGHITYGKMVADLDELVRKHLFPFDLFAGHVHLRLRTNR